MTQDRLQIAIEEHRSGRLRRAEAGYRSVLRDEPANLDAAHWLGVLLLQAGQADAALPLLEQAAAGRPGDAAFQHNLAEAYLAVGRPREAAPAFERALGLMSGDAEPAPRAQTLMGLGLARLARRGPDDAAEALADLRRARAAGLDSAELHHHLGVALLSVGRTDEAIGSLMLALDRRPEYASAAHHAALAYRAEGDAAGARRWLERAVAIDLSFARSWQALAAMEAEAGRLDAAAEMFRKAIAARPDAVAAYKGLAHVLEQVGRPREALAAKNQAARAARGELASATATDPSASVAELERRLTPTGDAAKLHDLLASVANVIPPARAQSPAVAALFDRYAARFDDHLQGKLAYRVPDLIAERVRSVMGAGGTGDVLDLGCGTGLCGPLLRPIARTLAGVDLSPAMVDQARARSVYDKLEVADLEAALRGARGAYDLLVAADVMNYTGDLAPIIEAAAAALRPAGLFAFTVEAAADPDHARYQLNPRTRRYAHGRAYVQHLARIYGLEGVAFDTVTLRTEANVPVEGYLVVVRAGAGAAPQAHASLK